MKRSRDTEKKTSRRSRSGEKKPLLMGPANKVPGKILNVLRDAGAVSEETALDVNVIISAVYILKNSTSSRIWFGLKALQKRGDVAMKASANGDMKCWMLSKGEISFQSLREEKDKDDFEDYYDDNINGIMNTIRDTGTTEGVVEPIDYSYKPDPHKGVERKPVKNEYGNIWESISYRSKKKMKEIYGDISSDPNFKYGLHAIMLVLYQCEAFDFESSIRAWDLYYRANCLIDFSVFKAGARFAEDAAIYENLCAGYVTYEDVKGNITKKPYYLTPDGIGYLERLLEREPENRKLLDKVAFLIKRDNDIMARKRSEKKIVEYPEKDTQDSSLASLLELTKRQSLPPPPPSSSESIRSIMALLAGEDEEEHFPTSNELVAFKNSGEKDEDGYRKEMREYAEKAFRVKYHPLNIPELFSFERKERYDDDEHLPQIVDVKMLIDTYNDHKTTEAIVSVFKEHGMVTEVRELPAGSFLWVGLDKSGNEYVLNTAIERITVVEHCILLKDNFNRSKKLLKGTHMCNLTFIMEGDGTMLENPDDNVFFYLHKSFNDLCSDGTFNLIRTLNIEETIAYLYSVTDQVIKEVKSGYGKGLLFWPRVTLRTLNAFVQSSCLHFKRYTGSLLQDSIDKFSFKTLDISSFM